MNGLLPVDEIRFRVEVLGVDSLKIPGTTVSSSEMDISLLVSGAPGALLSGKEVLLLVNENRLRVDVLVVDSLKVLGATVLSSERDISLRVDDIRVSFDVVVVTDFLSVVHGVRLQVIFLVISVLLHGSFVPGSHFLVSRLFPRPQFELR